MPFLVASRRALILGAAAALAGAIVVPVSGVAANAIVPMMSGDILAGERLSLASPGLWTIEGAVAPPDEVQVQFQRLVVGGTWADIAGATGAETASYLTTQADDHGTRLRVAVRVRKGSDWSGWAYSRGQRCSKVPVGTWWYSGGSAGAKNYQDKTKAILRWVKDGLPDTSWYNQTTYATQMVGGWLDEGLGSVDGVERDLVANMPLVTQSPDTVAIPSFNGSPAAAAPGAGAWVSHYLPAASRKISVGDHNVSIGWALRQTYQRFVTTPPAALAAVSPSSLAVTVSAGTDTFTTPTAHRLVVNQRVRLGTTGKLPNGVRKDGYYFVAAVPSATTFTLKASTAGSVIDLTVPTGTTADPVESGTHTVAWDTTFTLPRALYDTSVNGDRIVFDSGTLPSGVAFNTPYYLRKVGASDGGEPRIELYGGPAEAMGATTAKVLLFTAGSGRITVTRSRFERTDGTPITDVADVSNPAPYISAALRSNVRRMLVGSAAARADGFKTFWCRIGHENSGDWYIWSTSEQTARHYANAFRWWMLTIWDEAAAYLLSDFAPWLTKTFGAANPTTAMYGAKRLFRPILCPNKNSPTGVLFKDFWPGDDIFAPDLTLARDGKPRYAAGEFGPDTYNDRWQVKPGVGRDGDNYPVNYLANRAWRLSTSRSDQIDHFLAYMMGESVSQSVYNAYANKRSAGQALAWTDEFCAPQQNRVNGPATFNTGTGVINRVIHGLILNEQVKFDTTGTLPTPLVAGTYYYVSEILDASNVRVSAAPGGASLTLGGAPSGTHRLFSRAPGRTMDFEITKSSGEIGGGSRPYYANPRGGSGPDVVYHEMFTHWKDGTINLFLAAEGKPILTHHGAGRPALGRTGNWILRQADYKTDGFQATPVPIDLKNSDGARWSLDGTGTFFQIDTDPARHVPGTYREAATALFAYAPIQRVTVSIAKPARVTLPAHGFSVGRPFRFETSGALPTGLTPGVQYYVQAVPTPDTFTLAAAFGGPAIATRGTQSGNHDIIASAYTGPNNTGAFIRSEPFRSQAEFPHRLQSEQPGPIIRYFLDEVPEYGQSLLVAPQPLPMPDVAIPASFGVARGASNQLPCVMAHGYNAMVEWLVDALPGATNPAKGGAVGSSASDIAVTLAAVDATDGGVDFNLMTGKRHTLQTGDTQFAPWPSVVEGYEARLVVATAAGVGETIRVRFHDPANCTLNGGTAQVETVATVYDGFTVSDVNVSEEAGTATVTVSRASTNGGVACKVNYRTLDVPRPGFLSANAKAAVAGGDYTATSGQLQFGATDRSKTFTVPIIDNAIPEPAKDFWIEIKVPAAELGAVLKPYGRVTIAASDEPTDVKNARAVYDASGLAASAAFGSWSSTKAGGEVLQQFTTKNMPKVVLNRSATGLPRVVFARGSAGNASEVGFLAAAFSGAGGALFNSAAAGQAPNVFFAGDLKISAGSNSTRANLMGATNANSQRIFLIRDAGVLKLNLMSARGDNLLVPLTGSAATLADGAACQFGVLIKDNVVTVWLAKAGGAVTKVLDAYAWAPKTPFAGMLLHQAHIPNDTAFNAANMEAGQMSVFPSRSTGWADGAAIGEAEAVAVVTDLRDKWGAS